MVTLSKLIFNIKNIRNAGNYQKDYKFSDRQLEFIINHYRGELAAHSVNGKTSAEGYYQTLKFIPLVATDDYASEKAKVYKAVIPDVITTNGFGKSFKMVGNRNSLFSYQKTSQDLFNIDILNPMCSTLYFTVDSTLYIVTKSEEQLAGCIAKAIFGDPREAAVYNDSTVSGMDWDYPMPDNYIGLLTKQVMQGEFNWMNLLKQDNEIDGRDDNR